MGKRGRKVVVWGFIVMLLLLLGGCGSASYDAASNSLAGSEAANMVTSTAESEMDGGETSEVAADMAKAPAAGSGAPDSAADNAGSSSATVNSAPGFQQAAGDTGLNKKLIYRANVVMEVKDYAKAQSEIRNQVMLAGGYIVEFSENQSQHEQGGSFVLKVPAAGFSSFLDRLEGLKPVSMQRSIQGQDVSEEYVDLESRLKVKQAMEARYLKFVEEATQTKQLVEFVNELERIQTEIEQIKGRMRYIDSNVSFSTIEIRVYQPDASKLTVSSGDTPLLERMKNALTGSIDVLSLFFQWLVVFAAGALPLLVIAALVVIPVWIARRKNRAEREKRRAQLHAGPAAAPPGASPLKPGTEEEHEEAPQDN